MTGNPRRRKPSDDASPGGGLQGAGPGAAGQQRPLLDQAFDGDSLYALRAAVAAHGLQAGLAEGRVGDLVLAVHELAANAVCHGAGRGRLRLWYSGGTLRCEVTDGGAPHAAGPDSEATAASGSARWNIEPGHGLWMVRQVADQTSLRDSPSGTMATVSFTLGPPGEQPPFHLVQRFRDGCTLVSVSGQLDLGSARQLTRAVDDLADGAGAVCLVLDLSGLTGWDSSGLAALITAQQRLSGRPGARMIVAGLPGHLGQRLHDAGLSGRFTLAETVDGALRMLAPPP
jgi:anti-anti-sigma factor